MREYELCRFLLSTRTNVRFNDPHDQLARDCSIVLIRLSVLCESCYLHRCFSCVSISILAPFSQMLYPKGRKEKIIRDTALSNVKIIVK